MLVIAGLGARGGGLALLVERLHPAAVPGATDAVHRGRPRCLTIHRGSAEPQSVTVPCGLMVRVTPPFRFRPRRGAVAEAATGIGEASTPMGEATRTSSAAGGRPAGGPAFEEPEVAGHVSRETSEARGSDSNEGNGDSSDVSRETRPTPPRPIMKPAPASLKGLPEVTVAAAQTSDHNGEVTPGVPSSSPATGSHEGFVASPGMSAGSTEEGVAPDDGDTPLARLLQENAERSEALTRTEHPRPSRPRVLTVANQKGGVGKTTTAVNVAAALASGGLTVLVIDLDPQGNASTALGIDHHAEIASVYDVVVEGVSIAEVVQPCPEIDNLWCVPSTIDLAGAEIELVSLVARESRLKKAIDAVMADGQYDYVLIDCPPSLGLLTVNAFVAASEVLIPIQCEYYALEGLSLLLKNIDLIRSHLNPSLHVSTILLTMYDGRTRLSAQVAEDVREHFPSQVLKAMVPRSVRVSEAPGFGQTVITYDPASSGALSYREAAAEIALRGATASPKEN